MLFDQPFLAAYLPKSPDEIDTAAVTRLREYFDALVRSTDPSLDTRPGTPFGDLMLTPFSWMVAGCELAAQRFMQDQDLSNTEAGVTWHCDFVRALLANHGILDGWETTPSHGIVFLDFNNRSRVTLPRGLKFKFLSGTEEWTPRLLHPGDLHIIPPGQQGAAGQNNATLVSYGSLWRAVIEVEGPNSAAVTANSTAELDREVPGLVAATSATDFRISGGTRTFAAMAAYVRRHPSGIAPTSRAGLQRQIAELHRGLVPLVSVVMTGDQEMSRGVANILGLPQPAVTICSRSPDAHMVVGHTVALRYDTESDRFFGPVDYPSVLLDIDSVATDQGEIAEGDWSSISVTRDYARAPGLSCGLSVLERVWLSVRMPRDQDGNRLISTFLVDGTEHANFTLGLRIDPYLATVSDAVASGEFGLATCNPLVRGFDYIDLEVEIRHRAQFGRQVDTATAKRDIAELLSAISWPDAWPHGKIARILTRCGLDDFQEIVTRGQVRSSAARRMALDGQTTFWNWTDWMDHSQEVPDIRVNGMNPLQQTYNGAITGNDATWLAFGPRTLSLRVRPSDITFAVL